MSVDSQIFKDQLLNLLALMLLAFAFANCTADKDVERAAPEVEKSLKF